MEESVPRNPNELLFSFLTLKVSAKGGVAFVMAIAVSTLIFAVAWRLVSN
jgi:hypothetical protein